MDSVECRAIPGKGVALVAKRDFDEGDLLLRESPLLVFSISDINHISELEDICQKHRVPMEMLYQVFAVLNCDGAARSKVESLFFPGEEEMHRHTPCKEQYAIIRGCVEDVCNAGLLPNDCDLEMFLKLLLICKCNAVEVPQGMAVFDTFSRANHSCRPNAWHSMQGREKIVRAICPLKAGDEITYSYLGLDDLLKGSDIRIPELQLSKYFTCSCELCCLDASRAFRCSECSSLACYCSKDGVIGISCQNETCGHQQIGEELNQILDRESKLVQTVLALPRLLQQRHKGDPRKAMLEVVEHVDSCAKELHAQHWTAHYLNTLLRDFHQHILHSPPAQTITVLKKLLTYATQVYPGISYCAATAHKALAEEWIKSVTRADDFAALLQAKDNYLEALKVIQICNGPEHELTLQLKQALSKLEEPLAKKCANPTCPRAHCNLCAGCKRVGYCGKDCQAAHWKAEHKHSCGEVKNGVEQTSQKSAKKTGQKSGKK